MLIISNYDNMENTKKKFRGGSRAAATSKMERFVIIVNGWKSLTIITKQSIFDVAAALDSSLSLLSGVTLSESELTLFGICDTFSDAHCIIFLLYLKFTTPKEHFLCSLLLQFFFFVA